MYSVRSIFLTICGLAVFVTASLAQQSADRLPLIPARIPARPGAPKASPTPRTYGTTSVSYQRVGTEQFTPLDSGTAYTDTAYNPGTSLGRYSTGGDGYFAAHPMLPSGALVTTAELDYCDTNASLDVGLVVYSTDFTGQNATSIGTVTSSTMAGCGSTTVPLVPPFQVDNFANQLVLFAQTQANDSTTVLEGVILYYTLQVSPAPGTATFTDVPTTHPQFQFVQALVAAGITAGCGGGNYCPDAPLTRGQMAVYLSVALGLQWP
jgi:hypothetical protein